MGKHKVPLRGKVPGRGKPITEDEWVRRVNAMALEIDEYAASIHPSCWSTDEHLKALKKTYLKLAGTVTSGT